VAKNRPLRPIKSVVFLVGFHSFRDNTNRSGRCLNRARKIYGSTNMDEFVKTMLVVAAMAIPCIILAIAIIGKF